MSVIMTLRASADAAKIEASAADDPSRMQAIIAKAREHGLIAHRFYATDDGEIMVLDEWPDAESFQAFFAETEDEIGPMMAGADLQGEPEISFWHELNTNDQFGWGA
jgi:heme-degrading monooxygenase HmoA